MTTENTATQTTTAHDERTVRILAKSVYRQLKQGGASQSDIVGFTNAMLELVTSDVRESVTPDA